MTLYIYIWMSVLYLKLVNNLIQYNNCNRIVEDFLKKIKTYQTQLQQTINSGEKGIASLDFLNIQHIDHGIFWEK